MKQLFLGFLFALISIATVSAQNTEKHVFILSGQSNMARFQPEETFIPFLNNEFGEEQVLVVKDAQGGQPIRRWYKDWQPEEGGYTDERGDLYDRLIAKVKPALEGVTIKSMTFIWMQGERDAIEKHGNVYKESLKGLLNQLKKDVGREDINFIIGRLSDFGLNSEKRPHWNVVREAQMLAAKEIPNAAWIDCDDLNDGESRDGRIRENGLHYSIEGYKTLGERYAEKAIELIKSNHSQANKTLTWEQMNASKEVAKQAFNDAKFGMFIHWGLYSIPGGIWKDKKIEEYGRPAVAEWIQCTAKIQREEYAELATQFNPTDFDAVAIAKLAKDAGMKYLVITSKHHDGFAMYESKVSEYNIVDATPFKRDIVKELYDACKKEGIDFGLYYSHNIDWKDGHDCGYSDLMASGREINAKAKRKMGANVWDPNPNTFSEYLENKAYPQVKEILTKFPDLKTLWYDMPHYLTTEQSAKFYKIAYDMQPQMLINERVGNDMGDFDIPGDNKIPKDHLAITKPWQTVGTTNNSWGFKSYDSDWKSVKELLFWLTEIVSKGGNYMLNIGPDGSGNVPQESIDNLKEVGAWLKINGAAIYNTRKWEQSHEGPTNLEMNGTSAREQHKGIHIEFTPQDLWFTQNNKSLFAISLENNKRTVLIKSVTVDNYKVSEVKLLGLDHKIKWKQNEEGLSVKLPKKLPSKIGYVLDIRIRTKH